MMKKITSTILLALCFVMFTNIHAVASIRNNKNSLIKGGVNKTVRKPKPQKKQYKAPVIEDEFATEPYVKTVKTVKKVKYKAPTYEDDAVATLKSTKDKKLKQKKKYKRAIISDEEVILTEESRKFRKPVYTGKVKTDNGVEVVLKPVKKIKTKSTYLRVKNNKKVDKYKIPEPLIGEQVAFRVVNDVEKDGKILISKNTIVYARIAEVSPRAMGGAPAEMTIEKFEMMDKSGKLIPLDGEISSSGYSLSFWIGLAELATTPFLFGLAVPLLRVLPGGQAVVSPRKNYVVYY